MNMMDIDRWSHDSDNYKTIVSDQQTRNQTTNKKKRISAKYRNKHTRSASQNNYYSNENKIKSHNTNQHSNLHTNNSFKSVNIYGNTREARYRHMTMQQLNDQIEQLYTHKLYCVRKKKYGPIAKLEKQMESCIGIIKQKQIQKTRQYNIIQQNQLYQKHLQQMKMFTKTWNTIFDNYSKKEELLIVKLTRQQQKDVQQAGKHFDNKAKIQLRRHKNKASHVEKQWNKIQMDLLRQNKFDILSNLRIDKEMESAQQQISVECNKKLQYMRKKQEQRLYMQYEKKYACQKMKTGEQKQNQMKIYKKQKEMVKQRFLNKLQQLKHRQAQNERILESEIERNNQQIRKGELLN